MNRVNFLMCLDGVMMVRCKLIWDKLMTKMSHSRSSIIVMIDMMHQFCKIKKNASQLNKFKRILAQTL